MTAAARPSLRENVSGRAEPRAARDPSIPLGVVIHDVRWRVVIDKSDHDSGWWTASLVAVCEPCDWHRKIEDGYRTEQLVRLDAMHCGGSDAA